MQRFNYREMAIATPHERCFVVSQQRLVITGRSSGGKPTSFSDTAMALALRRAGVSR